ncbi:patatin-like protein 2 [Cornus florida]|uniref:patatin-like protein 2 n=1 Tax=Cornus florida TaxID=4283 RepID=UPI0028A0D187|nr:patatin-like protein 2 [Cornus florida]
MNAGKWGLLDWLCINGGTPLIDALTQASSDVVDIHVSSLFQALHAENNYLPIQDDTLMGDEASVDVAEEPAKTSADWEATAKQASVDGELGDRHVRRARDKGHPHSLSQATVR